METWVFEHEPLIRLIGFGGFFVLFAVWEALMPRRGRRFTRRDRWFSNLGIVVVNSLLVRLLLPASAVGVALFAETRGWGLFNYQEMPAWLAVAGAVLLLDFAIWLQHVMVHAIPVLWRLHRVHHADPDFDVTTGLRFHPLEIILSMLIKFSVILLLGAPALAVVIFEVVLNATAMFNHGNIALPTSLDRYLRWILVTPDMHRVHHSVEADETNSNFGFNLPWWDRLFGTYRAQPRAGHPDMDIGISSARDPRLCTRLAGMLALPFRGEATDYPINRRSWSNRP